MYIYFGIFHFVAVSHSVCHLLRKGDLLSVLMSCVCEISASRARKAALFVINFVNVIAQWL